MGQTVHQELALWLIFFISLSLLWQIVKPEQGLVPRTPNQQNFMALPNKLSGLTCSVTAYLIHPSLPCCITHQELKSQESAVSPVVRCTARPLRWLHCLLTNTWGHPGQFLWLMSFVTGRSCDARDPCTQLSTLVSLAKQWLHTMPKLESMLWTSGGSTLQDVSFQLINLEAGWMFGLEWKALGSRQAHGSENNHKF